MFAAMLNGVYYFPLGNIFLGREWFLSGGVLGHKDGCQNAYGDI